MVRLARWERSEELMGRTRTARRIVRSLAFEPAVPSGLAARERSLLRVGVVIFPFRLVPAEPGAFDVDVVREGVDGAAPVCFCGVFDVLERETGGREADGRRVGVLGPLL